MEADKCSGAESDAESAADSMKATDESHVQEGSEYLVKNTFIDTPLQRSPSFERFFGERKIHSSPPSVMVNLHASDNPFKISTPTGSSLGSDVGNWQQDMDPDHIKSRDSDIAESTTASGMDPLASACISSMPGSAYMPDAASSSIP